MAIKTDVNKVLLDELFSIYTVAEQEMLLKLSSRLKKGLYDPKGWNETKFSEVNALQQQIGSIVGNVNKIAKAKLSKGIKDVYMKGRKAANKELRVAETILTDYVPQHVERWILEANNLIDGTSFQILRNVDDVYRSTIAEASTLTMVGVETKEKAVQAALNKFASKGITGFVDKAGRHWDLASYTEMAVRTTTSRAALQGHTDRLIELEHDLIRISAIGTTCPICAQWQGKVLSIGGKDTNYPSLDSAKSEGVFHPNCKHTIVAYFPEIEEELGGVPEADISNNPWLYEKTQQQRYNERQIRKWKRVEAVAISPTAQIKARQKVRFWQSNQRELIEETGLRRNYKREGLKVGDAAQARPDVFKQIPKYTPKPKVASIPSVTVPKPEDLFYKSSGIYLGGAGDKSIYSDIGGNDYIYKPAVTKYGEDAVFKADIQEAASKLQKIVDPKSALDIGKIELEGKIGSIQKLLDVDSSFDLIDFYHNPKALNKAQVKQLQREHVTDWLLGNFDGHSDNFILTKDGKLIGIDKEQSFRYIREAGSQVMSVNYHPNSIYSEKEPIYNALFRHFRNGEIELDLNETLKSIKKVEKIPDAKYREMFRDYAYNLHKGDSDMAEELLDSIVKKKQNLRADYEEFYSSLLTYKEGHDIRFKFGATGKAPKKSPKIIFDESQYSYIGPIGEKGLKSTNEYIKKHSEYISKLPLDNSESIKKYTSSATDINYYLRNLPIDKDMAESLGNKRGAEALSKVFKRKDIPAIGNNVQLLRHAGLDTLSGAFSSEIEGLARDAISGSDDALKKLKKKINGSTFRDETFLSTSYKKGVFVESRGLELRMYIPKDYNKGLFVESISEFRTEAEYLIDAKMEFEIFDVLIEEVQKRAYGSTAFDTTPNIILKVRPKI